ncbi:SseB family protein [Streptomyces sp. NBC_00846]|uniref:SseB family protein n=1 Tax=Streptomyces sp. NBC_00846 TaxID=2975849 RepID=UPI00386E060A
MPRVLIYGVVSHLQGGGAVEQARTALAERIADRRRGVGDPRALVGEMRRSVLLVPTAGECLWSARLGGARWICGFTDETALARFSRLHASGDQAADYAALLGARIVDEVVPSLGEPAGLAVDIATEDGSMFFPPVVGIVPESVAVDAGGAEEVRGHER